MQAAMTWTETSSIRNINVLDFDTSNLVLTDEDLFSSHDKDKVLLYKLMSVSPHINRYLYSGNYGEDTISNHIVGCYLFPGRCRIRHWRGVWGM